MFADIWQHRINSKGQLAINKAKHRLENKKSDIAALIKTNLSAGPAWSCPRVRWAVVTLNYNYSELINL